MKLFSKIAFFFNIAFLIAVAMRLVERGSEGQNEPLSSLQPLENTLVIMGYCAILVNFVFLLTFLVARAGRKVTGLPRWVWIFNCIILVLQFLYFFVLP